MIEKREFYINGQWTAPAQGRDHQVIDPSTEEPCAVISLGGQADTDAAVAAARAALPGWMATSPAERIALVEWDRPTSAAQVRRLLERHDG